MEYQDHNNMVFFNCLVNLVVGGKTSCEETEISNMYIAPVVCFLLGNSPASEFYMPTFRNTLLHLHRQVGV
jgi:hypothetical protein